MRAETQVKTSHKAGAKRGTSENHKPPTHPPIALIPCCHSVNPQPDGFAAALLINFP